MRLKGMMKEILLQNGFFEIWFNNWKAEFESADYNKQELLLKEYRSFCLEHDFDPEVWVYTHLVRLAA